MKIKSLPNKKSLSGKIIVPGDKSISHRSIIITSISNGKSVISNLLESEDVIKTLKALKKLGVKIEKKNNKYIIYGKGLNSLKKTRKNLYLGNSGTSARLLIGLLSPQPFDSKIYGDSSLSKRPMNRIIKPLTKMGASFLCKKNKKLPIKIKGNKNLKPIKYNIPIPSAQIKSGILLASLYIKETSIVTEKINTRDHTEKLLKIFGSKIIVKKRIKGQKILIKGKKELKAHNLKIPGDFSSAAFFIVAALIIKGSKVTLRGINLNPTRTGLLKALSLMKANIIIKNKKYVNGEVVGDIIAKYSKLKGCNLKPAIAPLMIDEYPILSIAASFASGPSKFYGLNELKYKESNRLLLINRNLLKCGIKSKINNNNLTITPSNLKLNKIININSEKDHRIAMSFAIMGMLTTKGIIIDDAEYINTSFPDFIKKINKLGANII